MELIYLSVICLIFPVFVTTLNVQIQAQPPTVNFGQDNLVIICSVINPAQLSDVLVIQLQRNFSSQMQDIVLIKSSGEAWQNSGLQSRASATGSIESPSTAQLRFTIAKENVRCPEDFTGYSCTLTALGTGSTGVITQTADQIYVAGRVEPAQINMPSVRILGDTVDTPLRQFEVGTAIQLTCLGQVGSDASATIRWCAKTANALSFTGLSQTPILSEASLSGCQYTRSSTITYNLTSDDTYTQFLCESGYSSLCETGTARQYLNITLEGNAGTPSTRTSEDTSDAGIIAGGVIGGLAFLILVILLVYFLVLRRKTDGETSSSPTDRTKEDVPGYNGPANPEGPVYSVPVRDHPPERQELLDEREDADHHGNGTATQEEPRKELHYADLDIATQPPGTRVKPQPKPRAEVTNTEYASVTFGSTV